MILAGSPPSEPGQCRPADDDPTGTSRRAREQSPAPPHAQPSASTTPDAATEDDAATEVDAATDDAATDDAATDDASAEDASADAASDDAATDGGSVDATTDAAPSCVKYVSACSFFDDWDVATTGMSTYDVVVTRLRTTLPATALTKDLTLGASVDQSSLSKNITSQGYTVPNYDPCPGATSQPPPAEGCGCDTAGQNNFVVSTSLSGLALVALARRRRRRRS